MRRGPPRRSPPGRDPTRPSPPRRQPDASPRPLTTIAPAAVPPVSEAEPEPERRSRKPLIFGAALAAAAAVVVAIVVSTGGGEPPVPTPEPTEQAAQGADEAATASLSSGPLSIQVPAGWAAGSGGEPPPGFVLTDAVRSSPPDASNGAIVLGLAPSAETTHALLPAALLEDGEAPPRTEVTLGTASGYRYDGLPGGLTVYAVPTDKGVATLACEPPVTEACAGTAATLALDGATALQLGPSEAYAGAVSKELRVLDRIAAATTAASTPLGQSRLADRLRGRASQAATRLRRLQTGPAEAASTLALAGAAKATASGYERLASAAKRSDRRAYNSAAANVRAARRDLIAALGGLKAAGYTSFEAPRAPTIAPLARRKVAAPTATATPSSPQATPTPAPTTRVTPRATSVATPKPTPVPAKPTPVPIEGGD